MQRYKLLLTKLHLAINMPRILHLFFRSKLVDKLLQPACIRLIFPFLKGEKRRLVQRRCYRISVSFYFTRMRDLALIGCFTPGNC